MVPNQHPLASLAVLALVALAGGCQSAGGPGADVDADQPMPISAIRQEPFLRVRVGQGCRAVNLSAEGEMEVWSFGPRGATRPRTFATPLAVHREGGDFVVGSWRQGWFRFEGWRLMVEPVHGGTIAADAGRYPGKLALEADPHAAGPGEFDLVNHVLLEQYLPGVLAKELYASWHPEAFRAQAVAARSYAIAQLGRSRQRVFDLESTTASQVYVGQTSNPRALEAVQATRGLVLTCAGEVLCAYYSASCGGRGQDAAAAFPGVADLPPLRGREHGGWCSDCPNFRWGPIVVDAAALARRIAAWGRAHRHPVGDLRGISTITVAARSRAGRPAWFALTDLTGWRCTLGCEQFRMACNYAAPGTPGPGEAQKLKSSDVEVRVAAGQVRFDQGRGFGHGVGLCQWGAQAQAAQGYAAASILAFYYPGAEIRRAY